MVHITSNLLIKVNQGNQEAGAMLELLVRDDVELKWNDFKTQQSSAGNCTVKRILTVKFQFDRKN